MVSAAGALFWLVSGAGVAWAAGWEPAPLSVLPDSGAGGGGCCGAARRELLHRDFLLGQGALGALVDIRLGCALLPCPVRQTSQQGIHVIHQLIGLGLQLLHILAQRLRVGGGIGAGLRCGGIGAGLALRRRRRAAPH